VLTAEDKVMMAQRSDNESGEIVEMMVKLKKEISMKETKLETIQ